MRLNAFLKDNATAEYWEFTTALNPETGVPEDEYYFVENVSVVLTGAGEGALAVYSPRELMRNASLRDLRDAKGNYVYTDGNGNSVDAYIHAGEPVLNVYGVVEGYRYTLTRGA